MRDTGASMLCDARYDTSTKTGTFLLYVGSRPPHPVSVTRRGILNIASPPRDTSDCFFAFLHAFHQIAVRKLEQNGEEASLRITAEDVKARRTQQGGIAPLRPVRNAPLHERQLLRKR